MKTVWREDFLVVIGKRENDIFPLWENKGVIFKHTLAVNLLLLLISFIILGVGLPAFDLNQCFTFKVWVVLLRALKAVGTPIFDGMPIHGLLQKICASRITVDFAPIWGPTSL